MSDDLDDIPAFLVRKPGEVRAVAPTAAAADTQAAPERRRFDLPRHIEPAGLAILEAVEGHQAAKQAQRDRARFEFFQAKQAEAAAERERRAAIAAAHQHAVREITGDKS